MSSETVVLLNTQDGRKMVRRKCKELGLPMNVLEELIDEEIAQVGKKRKAGLWEEIDRIFDSMDEEGGS